MTVQWRRNSESDEWIDSYIAEDAADIVRLNADTGWLKYRITGGKQMANLTAGLAYFQERIGSIVQFTESQNNADNKYVLVCMQADHVTVWHERSRNAYSMTYDKAVSLGLTITEER